MRINTFIAQATGLSRRQADHLIQAGRVNIGQQTARLGDQVTTQDRVTVNGRPIKPVATLTILLNKPAGYVCSRRGQGSRTIYELLPSIYHQLKPVGRLDKDSSGLLLLTNDGELANQLTHPRHAKEKLYEIELDKTLSLEDQQAIQEGISLEDGLSKLTLKQLSDDRHWRVTMQEGRNRQIRRTFAALGYQVQALHRTQFGAYHLTGLYSGQHRVVTDKRLNRAA